MNKQTTVFITGATGSMGYAALKQLVSSPVLFNIVLLARPSKKNHKKLAPFADQDNIKIIWGDLTSYDDILEGVTGSDIVLHIGAMIPPQSERNPEKTLQVNTQSMQFIVDAIKSQPDPDSIKIVYIGSISQYGDRKPPYHWARTGDPISPSIGDCYSLSKIIAERIIAESGLKYWVSLRQTGMLCKEMLYKGSDPLTFHVPIDGVLEWSTVEDSGVLLRHICEKNMPGSFWRKFYNIGNGGSYRLSNLQFEEKILHHLCCPPPDKVFETNWFAIRNFHGVWYYDSDKLERLVSFRSSLDCDEYMANLSESLPAFFKLARFVPSFIIKFFMGKIARKAPLAPLSWIMKDPEGEQAKAAFGSVEEWESIPDWNFFRNNPPSQKTILLQHGYDSEKEDCDISAQDLISAASFRGGKCIDPEKFSSGDMFTTLEWECCFGHHFKGSANTILRGGHWCPECLKSRHSDEEAKHNLFFAQIWLSSHPQKT